MSFLPQITCRNCGAKFSPLLGRCPSCGTRYLKNPFRSLPFAGASTSAASGEQDGEGRAPGPGVPLELTNLQWQMIFGGILIVAVIVAVIILITASLNPAERRPDPTAAPTQTSSVTEGEYPGYNPDDPSVTDYVVEPGYTTDPPAPTVAVSSVTITYQGETRTEFAMNPIWGDVQLGATVYPTNATATVTWRSSDTSICTVDDTGLVHQVGTGTCTIIAECGGVAQRCTVYALG